MKLQRLLLKLDKVHGVVWVPLGLAGLAGVRFWPHYTYEIGSIVFFSYVLMEGAKKLLSDPVKQSIAVDIAKAEHWVRSGLGCDPTGVTAPEPAALSAAQAPSPAPPVKDA